jgi:hypothetical protein
METPRRGDPALRRTLDPRTVALILGGAAIGCLVIAALSKSWLGNPSFSGAVRDRNGDPTLDGGRYFSLRGDLRFGPTGFEHCVPGPDDLGPRRDRVDPLRGARIALHPDAGTCVSLSTSELNDLIGGLDLLNRAKLTSGAFPIAGWIAFGGCLAAAAALAVAWVIALLRRRPELPVSPPSIALVGVFVAMGAGCVFVATKPGPSGMVGVDLGFWAFGAGTVVAIVSAQLLARVIRPVDRDLLDGALRPADFDDPM